MKIGVSIPIADGDSVAPGYPGWREIEAFGRRAEELGLDSLWAPDHLLPHLDALGGPGAIHEGWTIVTALAAVTSRIGIGHLVIAAPWRNPALLAKMAVTLDEISDGRLILGLGTGYHEPEFAAYGYPPAHDRPVSRLEEALHVIVPLLRGEQVSFEGRFVAAREAVLLPAPKRRIPILVAGERPRMLRLSARWADLWNTAWYGRPDDRLSTRLAGFEAALAEEGRGRETIGVSVGMWVGQEAADEIAATMARFAERGADQLILRIEAPRTEASLERIGAAVERYRAGVATPAGNAA
jgi:alkanesulfonate monooxygenase SsuD/methylene tetrahydromethanopterin reductase-like flavin-dependent oxidoreductase (luciferase family)